MLCLNASIIILYTILIFGLLSYDDFLPFRDEDEDFNDIKEELNLDDLDEIMLMGLMESKTPSDADLIVKNEPPGSTTSVGDAIADLPLLDQSEDPYLNDGSDPLSSVLFGSDELDSTVHKWMEACESNLLPL